MTGQCRKCFDLFTVEMRLVEKPAKGDLTYYRPQLTARLAYQNHQLIHRPEHCGGVVRLFASPRLSSF